MNSSEGNETYLTIMWSQSNIKYAVDLKMLLLLIILLLLLLVLLILVLLFLANYFTT